MFGTEYLLIPGPTPVPERVVRAMQQPIINHRGPVFHEIMAEVVDGMRKVFKTAGSRIMFCPSSGTGMIEASAVNFISPGDKVLVISIGNFGNRLAEVAEAFGGDVEKMDFEWGTAADPEKIRERLAADTRHEIKVIMVTHNETSTGVFNNIEKISAARGDHPAIMIVDAVSSLGAIDVQMDNWKLDVVLSGSQKALMLPPGLGMMAFNERAYEVYKKNTNHHYYWDIDKAMKFQAKGETPFTPPVSIYFGLQESLKMLLEEGIDNALKRHLTYRALIRGAMDAIGLKNVADEACASPGVTAVYVPEGHTPGELRGIMLNDYNMVVSGGQGKLSDTTFRIGHLGCIREMDLVSCVAALEMTLKRLNVPVELGAGVKRMQEILLAK